MWHDFDYFIDKGDEYYHIKDFNSAIIEYSKAIKKEPNNITGYIRRGNAYDKNEDFEAAIQDYTIALTLPPMGIIEGKKYNSHISAFSSRAHTLVNLKKFKEAENDCYAALKIDPLFIPCLVTLGKIFQIYGNNREAIKYYSKIHRIDPNCELGYWYRGDLYKDLGKYERAIEDYKKVLEIDPDNEFMKDDIADCLDLLVENEVNSMEDDL